MTHDIVFTIEAAKPPAASSQGATLPARLPGLRIVIAAIAEAKALPPLRP